MDNSSENDIFSVIYLTAIIPKNIVDVFSSSLLLNIWQPIPIVVRFNFHIVYKQIHDRREKSAKHRKTFEKIPPRQKNAKSTTITTKTVGLMNKQQQNAV